LTFDSSTHHGLVAKVSNDVPAFLACWAQLQHRAHAPFQTAAWLRSWYETIGRSAGSTAVCVTISRGGRPIMLLPLVAIRAFGFSVVCFADRGVTDYNAPLIVEPPLCEPEQLWKLVRKALAGHDVIYVKKMLGDVSGFRNFLADALPSRPQGLCITSIVIGADYDAWMASLSRNARRHFRRTLRAFYSAPSPAFERVTEVAAALQLFNELEALQRARLTEASDPYVLDQLVVHDFYENRLRSGLADGSVVMTALRSAGELVAALYAVSDGTRHTFLRIAGAGAAWNHSSPGRLLLERTMHHLHAEGFREFGFGLGDHPYKSVFNVSKTDLLGRVGIIVITRRPDRIGLALVDGHTPSLDPRRLAARPRAITATGDRFRRV
jgi:CelD/BcsL family acetyltransferase involved in cellulose biosynthesis